ncbi:hypothetical protein ACROYT_G031993 [Oculina patagonica]
MENKHDVKNLWKILKRVAPTKPTKKSPAYIEVDGAQISKPEEMANAFNQYFTSISAPTASDNIDSTEFEALLSEFTESGSFNTPPPFEIPPITGNIIEQDLRKISLNKATGLDEITYRANHSCETALLNITDKWLKEMDNSKLVGTVFMDLSKAFDLVNHDILQSKLSKYHISPKALEWFTSYLCNRSQQCSMSGSLSSPLELKLGVPQGSILGPTLFSIYINDLPLSLKKAEVDIYADDTTIWSSGNTCEEIQQKLQDTLDSAGKWFKAAKHNKDQTVTNWYSPEGLSCRQKLSGSVPEQHQARRSH